MISHDKGEWAEAVAAYKANPTWGNLNRVSLWEMRADLLKRKEARNAA